MPVSSSALAGEFHPTPFYTHTTASGQPIESAQEAISPRNVQADVSSLEDIPTVVRRPAFVPKLLKIGIPFLLACAIGAGIAVPLALTLSKSNSADQSTTTMTTMTTTSATTATETTSTSVTTKTTSTTSTSSTSSTTTTTTSTTSTSSTSSTTSLELICFDEVEEEERNVLATTTSVAQSPSRWSFDGNYVDSTSIFNGNAVNSPTFQNPGITGYTAALSLVRSSSQYVNTSYRSLTSTSFTVSLWFYWTASSGADYGLFGQCDSANPDKSLHYQIRNYLLYLAFFNDDLPGVTTLQGNQWYHVAFVFDYPSSKQIIYLNGIFESSRTSLAYQGLAGATVLGKTEQVPGTPNYFNGYIDEMILVIRTKSATEILTEATLVTWHSFDSNSSYTDSGPLALQITTNNLVSVNGRVNQAISFTTNSSYYQVNGFVLLGVSNGAYSLVIWIYPLAINGSTLIHLSTTTSGQGWCVDLMGFSSTGQIIVTGWSSVSQQVIGPLVPTNTWTHVVDTYSQTNGHRLYVNGTLIGTTGSMTYMASNAVNILTLGNPLQAILVSAGGTCNAQSISPKAYRGSLDEFRVYSRELNQSEITSLANP